MIKLIITIDGPAAAGKGTIAYLVARAYKLLNLDSGAVYRAVAWLARDQKVPVDEFHENQIVELLQSWPITFVPNAEALGPKSWVHVGDTDVTALIRTEEISELAARVGSMMRVRVIVTELQRHMAEQSPRGIVVEGRDTGIVVFPDANLKFFLTATAEVRAQRRHAELIERGMTINFDQVYSDLQERDRRDTERAYSALRIAEDARMIDATELTIEQVVAQICQLTDEYLAQHDTIQP